MRIVIPIEGMHCRACEITIKENLEKVPRVIAASASLKNKSATIEAISQPNQSDLLKAVQSAGYNIGTAKQPWISHNPADYKDFFIGVLIIVALAIIYNVFGISKIITVGSPSNGGLGIALLTGLAAGVSTCMALVGGLVLGLSAKHAQAHPNATTIQKFRPHLFFNISRIVSFFILGGVIGLLGATFQLQGAALGVSLIVVGVVMLTLGLQLTKLFPRISAGRISLPPAIANFLGLKKHTDKEYSHKSAIALGAISFFLPCGFTQIMQLYAISSGSFITGALIMSIFAVGTAPGLLGIGGLTSVIKKQSSGRVFKIAGVAVMAMALINISNGYNLTGFQIPSFGAQTSTAVSDGTVQTVETTYTLNGDISPKTFTLKSNTAYRFIVNSKDDGQGCMSTIMIPGLFNKPLVLEKDKQQILSFTTKGAGSYQITCAMGINRGSIKVI